VISAAFYHNWVKDEILFTQDPAGNYTAARPPANWPPSVPPFLINFIPPPGLPGLYTYRNFGKSTTYGFELGVTSPVNNALDVYANYSWQSEPDPEGFELSELNLPPTNRFNAGLNVNYGRYVANYGVAFTDDAFWQDVLNDPYHGTTEAYTLVNAGFGVRFLDNKLTATFKGTNLGNADAQQHVFGDIVKRQLVGELKVQF
jgi:hypothetical protein